MAREMYSALMGWIVSSTTDLEDLAREGNDDSRMTAMLRSDATSSDTSRSTRSA